MFSLTLVENTVIIYCVTLFERSTDMLAKSWKKIGFLILIVACLFNITIKLVKRVSFTDNVKSTVSNKVDNVVTEIKGEK